MKEFHQDPPQLDHPMDFSVLTFIFHTLRTMHVLILGVLKGFPRFKNFPAASIILFLVFFFSFLCVLVSFICF